MFGRKRISNGRLGIFLHGLAELREARTDLHALLPRKRRQSERDFQRRIAQLKSSLQEALTRQVHLELEQSSGRINEAIAPYRRFVQSQQQRLNEARGELVATEDALLRLRADVEKR